MMQTSTIKKKGSSIISNNISMGISLPKEMLSRIDGERGDIPRSRFILRKLEQVYLLQSDVNSTNDSRNKNNSSGSSHYSSGGDK